MAKGKGRARREETLQGSSSSASEAASVPDPPPRDDAPSPIPTHTMADVELLMNVPPRRYTVGEIATTLLCLAQLCEDGACTLCLVAIACIDMVIR